jgi:DNA-binding CsgD family transcriptional regulator
MALLERESQLQALHSALNQVKAREGQGCVALVYGEAGIGKTSLIEHFINEHKTKWRILQGACDSLFTPRPLGPLHDIALQMQGHLLSLLESESNRTAIFSACLSELQQQTTILVIEDIHWADETTLDLLKYLGRRIRQTVSLMILTYRDDEMGNDHPLRILLGDLASSHALHRIPVSLLSKEAVCELAKNKKVDSLELHRLTNGNPFFVTEVLAVESGIPETVRDAVLARAARLSLSARTVLEAAAVIGSRAEAWLLSNLVGEEIAKVEECIAKGMLQSQDGYYAFRHELAQQTIIESISPQRKIALHHMTLNALKESPKTCSDLARLANHAKGTMGAHAVLEYAPAAARQASALGAHRQAASHYKSALQYADLIPAEKRAELLDAYVDECDVSDQMTEAEQTQQQALCLWRELGQREKEGRALRRLSEIAIKLNQKLDISLYAAEAITILETLSSTKELARAYSLKSRLHMFEWQNSEAIYWGLRSLELAERLGDIETQAHALINVGLVEIDIGQHAQGFEKLECSLQLSITHGLHEHAARAYYNLTSNNFALNDYMSGLYYAKEGIVYCIQHEIDLWHLGLLGLRARAQLKHGNWTEAEQDLQDAQAFWGTLERRAIVEPTYFLLKVRRGDPLSWEALESGLEFAHMSANIESSFVASTVLAEAAWLRDGLKRCQAEVETMLQIACQRGVSKYIGELAYWVWRAGAMKQSPPNAAEPYAKHISGDWKAAAAIWDEYGYPYEQAMALMDGDEAAQLAALEIFERLGAHPIIEKLKRQMRAQEIRIPRGPRPATRENPFGLTSREREVATLIAQGKSNREIAYAMTVGVRTVETYVTRVLNKLNFESRGQVAIWAIERGLLSSKSKN